jgi:hypothetical protein
MATPSELVTDAWNQAQNYAETATAEATVFTDALSAAITVAPTIEVSWESLSAPSALGAPSRPAAIEEVEDDFEWDQDGSIAASKPTALDVVAPSLTIDDFDEVAPTVDFGEAPVLDFGTAPTLDIGTAPTVPEIADIAVPEAPTIELPDTPTYLSLTTPTFGGVDLNAEFLANLEDIPTLELVAPTPYSYTRNPEYESALLSTLQATLNDRLGGGTGLDTTVETAIWDRAREREASIAQAGLDEVQRLAEAGGFALPTGVLLADTRAAQRNYYDKVSGLSRDIAIKQAELEQENLKQAVTASIELEGKLIDYSLRIEMLAFESAKYLAENAVAIYNAQVEKYKTTVQAYTAYATAYRAIIDGELAKVEVFKAEIQAELAKAETNKVLVQQYEAEVRARLSTVELFRAQVEGAKAQMELEGARLAAVGEQIKAYIAGINGETAKVEAYKAQVQAEGIKADAYKSGVDAQLATVEVYKAKAQAFSAKVNGQAENARAQISFYNAKVQAKAQEWDGWRARVAAETERIRAAGIKSNSALDAYRADIVRYEAEVKQDLGHWEASIKQYEATRNYTLAAEKLNTEIIRANNNALLEASKVGAQVHSQLASSAYGIINAQASVQAQASNSVQYQYKNDTLTAPPAVTAV